MSMLNFHKSFHSDLSTTCQTYFFYQLKGHKSKKKSAIYFTYNRFFKNDSSGLAMP